ncbi:MAG: GGDEF domain-containing phosphodiesterase, partial [Alphaproteobacteria bacterium]|nr:GGDEF domain-containing phosphodiesterase [Alphaproteobacteria bacterium]
VQLLKNADLALYRAKEDGRGVMRFYEPVMDADMLARRALESELRQALIQGDFELFYQPLIDLSTNEISGLEALIRWNHTERGLVAPSDFVPFAEEIGLIVPIGDWVLTRACLDAASWSVPVSVAVNLSPAQFKNGHLTASVIEALDTAGLKPSRLELEITESVLLQNTEHTIEVLRELRELGVRISMDDFGTGYSPLSYIRRFPFDKIKIDQAFVSDLDNDADAIAIIRAIADLGGSLGIRTTGEGVETEEQLRTLRRQGCTEVQGYLFSPPRPAADIEELLIGLSKTSARSIARSTVS